MFKGLPASLVILGMRFRVKYYPGPVDDLKEDEFGDTDGANRLIRINLKRHNSETEIFATLFHEACHAALYVSGQTSGLGKREEAIIMALEHALFPLIQQRKIRPGKNSKRK